MQARFSNRAIRKRQHQGKVWLIEVLTNVLPPPGRWVVPQEEPNEHPVAPTRVPPSPQVDPLETSFGGDGHKGGRAGGAGFIQSMLYTAESSPATRATSQGYFRAGSVDYGRVSAPPTPSGRLGRESSTMMMAPPTPLGALAQPGGHHQIPSNSEPVGLPPVESLRDRPFGSNVADTGMSAMSPIASSYAPPIEMSTPASFAPQTPKSGGRGIFHHLRSPAQTDRFNEGGLSSGDVLDDRWVTIYGFPSNALNVILRHFQNYGTIVQHRAGQGNWVHVQYATRMEGQKALSKSGKIFDQYMIGVKPCVDKSVMSGGGSSEGESELNMSTRLTPGKFRAARSEYDIDTNILQAPKPRTSLWSKVSEYIFGV